VETPPSSQIKVEVASAPVIAAPPVPHSEQAVTEVPEVKISALPVPKAHTAIEHADPAVKSKQHAELEIRREVMQWAEAWSRRDVASYLSFYAADFNPPDGMQRATWEEQRKSRLRQYQSIKLTLKNMKINYSGGNAASVSFSQHFKADNHLEIQTNKELDLRNSHGRWKILSEKTK